MAGFVLLSGACQLKWIFSRDDLRMRGEHQTLNPSFSLPHLRLTLSSFPCEFLCVLNPSLKLVVVYKIEVLGCNLQENLFSQLIRILPTLGSISIELQNHSSSFYQLLGIDPRAPEPFKNIYIYCSRNYSNL